MERVRVAGPERGELPGRDLLSPVQWRPCPTECSASVRAIYLAFAVRITEGVSRSYLLSSWVNV